MDADGFDTLVRVLAAPRSRRTTIGALLAALLAPLGGLAAPKAERCVPVGRSCGRRRGKRGRNKGLGKRSPCKQCCTRFSVKTKKGRRCACKPDGAKCERNNQCCGGRCQGGTCLCQADVCPSGCAFSSVQAGINAARDGDTITLCPGTYPEHVTIGKNLTVTGAGAGRTIIDGQGIETDQPVVFIQAGTTVLLQALTVTGGNSTDDGGGIFIDAGTLTLDRVSVTANTAFGDGGGIENSAGSLTLIESSVTGNTTSGWFGGGIDSCFDDVAEVTLINSRVTGNTAAGLGGGIMVEVGTLTVAAGSRVTGNTAGDEGGGIYTFDGAMTTIEPGAAVTNNDPNNCSGPFIGTCIES